MDFSFRLRLTNDNAEVDFIETSAFFLKLIRKAHGGRIKKAVVERSRNLHFFCVWHFARKRAGVFYSDDSSCPTIFAKVSSAL